MSRYVRALQKIIFFFLCGHVAQPVWALESTTQAYLLTSNEPLWRIELSSSSFDRMIRSVDQNDPIRSTLENIGLGFSELSKENDPYRVLAFEWHTTSDKKTMCKLYPVGDRNRQLRRQLITRRAYANIEHRKGSCRDQGRHIQQLVIFQRTYTMLASGKVWGAIVAQHKKIKQYSPIFLQIHSTAIPVGMIPMSKIASLKSGTIPASEWTTWKSDKIFEKLSVMQRIPWKGIEIKQETKPISIDVWRQWTEALGGHMITSATGVMWPDAKSRIDTPPVSIVDWQQSMYQSATLDLLVQVREWNRINLQEMGWKVKEQFKGDSWDKAIMAAQSSMLIYGVPDYGVLIGTICPLGFLSGENSCVLPKLGKTKAANIYKGHKILQLYVPLLKGKDVGAVYRLAK